MTKTEDLPVCSDRWCKNKARYVAPRRVDWVTGEDGESIPLCGVHLRSYENSNAKTRRRVAYRQRQDDICDRLGPALTEAIKRKAGIDVTIREGRDAESIVISLADAEKILAWLDGQ